jgi:RNA ligase (TIGR02306 family)
MSTHEAKVICIEEILSHPDPETVRLGVVKIWDYQCIIAKDMWKVGDLAVYIEPDTLVDGSKPEFSFLNGDKEPRTHRIKAKRLRGAWSEGLLVPAPEGFKPGDDAWTHLGLERFVPKPSKAGKNGSRAANLDTEFGMGGSNLSGPVELPFEKYDIEAFKKYNKVFEDGEEVVVTEKIHGCNAKFAFSDGKMWAGSRTNWKDRAKDVTVETPSGPITYSQRENVWWAAIDQHSWIESLCKATPENVVFGEVFGQVQDLKYGAKANELFFRVFDIWSTSEKKFLSFTEVCSIISRWQDGLGEKKPLGEILSMYYAPILYVGSYSKEKIFELTDGKTLISGGDHVREGVVIKPTSERQTKFGRVILKNVSNSYLERA